MIVQLRPLAGVEILIGRDAPSGEIWMRLGGFEIDHGDAVSALIGLGRGE
jgi:hypothetical protein